MPNHRSSWNVHLDRTNGLAELPGKKRIFSSWLDRWACIVYLQMQLCPRCGWLGRLDRDVVESVPMGAIGIKATGAGGRRGERDVLGMKDGDLAGASNVDVGLVR